MRRERGSALLIVFLFAAILAITLYTELPSAAFEAQRNREELAIDRGNEYAHAVKLFVRKFGTYPTSIEQLENTNQMRFLRRRFKDPLTGKDDWRLLHAGPGGQLLDSKVNPIGNTTGNNSKSGSSTSTNSTKSGFGDSFDSSSEASSPTGQATVAAVRQRPPAVPANGAASSQAGLAAEDQNPLTPLLTPEQTASAANPASTASDNTNPPSASNETPGARSATSQSATTSQTAATTRVGTGNSTTGTITSGGIAGVASKAEGTSIKTVNDQDQYSLWEFYYDPSKDAARGITNAQANISGAAQNAGTQQNSSQTPSPAPNPQQQQ